MFRRILLATDGSDHACKALKQAVQLANDPQTELIIVHAFAPVVAVIGTPFYHTLLESHLVEGEHLLHEMVAQCGEEGVIAYHDLRHGPPAEAILDSAEVNECDLIVMGAHGVGGSEGQTLGSAVSEVLNKAKCPVLVVR